MRINIITGFFLPVPPLRGGSTEKIWHRLAEELAAAGHQVTLLSRAWPGLPAQETRRGVEHRRVSGFDHHRNLVVNLWRDLRWGRRIASRLPSADATICNTVSLPVWLRRRRPDAGKVVAVMARMPKGHGHAYRNVDLLLSLSAEVTRRLQQENPRLAARIAPFPYPIDWRLHADAARARGENRAVAIGYVGRIHPEKGLHLLFAAALQLAAMSALPAWRISLVGPQAVPEGGGGTAYVDTLLAQLPAGLQEKVGFHPPEYDPTALARIYGQLDIFCYPSVAESGETFGVAVAEAMAAGAVPVVSDLACFRTLVSAGETGLIFDHRAGDAADQLARSLGALIQDRALRARLSRAALAHVQQFDFGICAQQLAHRLEKLVQE